MIRKDCFDFGSEMFGEMRHSTEEEKKLYEDMLERTSIDIEVWNNREVEIDTPSDLRFC